jgi:hypothetical protein
MANNKGMGPCATDDFIFLKALLILGYKDNLFLPFENTEKYVFH